MEPPQPPPAAPEVRGSPGTAGAEANSSGVEEDPMLFCPVCSERLEAMRCKLMCTKCGYYMSCADYY